MCGLCSGGWPAEIAPYNIMLLSRRMGGKHIQKPYRNLPSRLKEIEQRRSNERLAELMTAEFNMLKEVYRKQEADNRIVETNLKLQ